MPTSVKENYLKALYFLQEKGQNINVTELSKKLGVSKPTVSNMLKSLEDQEWVIYRKYKPIEFTEKGKKQAALIIRKHRLAEVFLHKVMKFGWEEVHDIAEQIEHIKSPILFQRMDEMLDFPKTDPHGSPIPNKNGNIESHHYLLLSQFQAGTKVKLCALENSTNKLLVYLNEKNIKLGTEIEILSIEPFDQSVVIKYDDHDALMISQKVADCLLVKEI
ncbi:MAG: metal-dependent transcriptional regulator [Saprospiraceae bacterium]|nr:metal-dependent transcriptional regulator [Bacteroidia bacterium]NNE14550.1 metal-dependent transcriptional regulator [Saprospiraceae bacterium]NNL92428.1 metal-dependent transcriptional regulator [Saprospiraceae bacterium]